ncbi:DinB family protein [Streptomyces sp. NPDC093510]|uniref:DinB family protein n=1 Tax=Streptomyces sp. NPDC093510 TaxID=3155199 RepID=UPI003421209E
MPHTDTTTPAEPTTTGERADLLEALTQHRTMLRHTVRALTDEEAGRRTTASELCLGGIIKHVTSVERVWVAFIRDGLAALGDVTDMTDDDWAKRSDEFRTLPGETLAGVLDQYAEVARHTDEFVRGLPDLDVTHPLPEAPWWEPGGRWTARRTLLHIIGETAQHAGHADIIREHLDGALSMA